MIELPKPIEVKALKGFKISVIFSDGKSGEVDLNHLLQMKVFKRWEQPGYFEKVFIADDGRCIAWDDELEICPNTLYLNVIKKSYEEYASN